MATATDRAPIPRPLLDRRDRGVLGRARGCVELAAQVVEVPAEVAAGASVRGLDRPGVRPALERGRGDAELGGRDAGGDVLAAHGDSLPRILPYILRMQRLQGIIYLQGLVTLSTVKGWQS